MEEEAMAELEHCFGMIYRVASEPNWYKYLGKLLIRSGEPEKAELMLEHIIEISNEGNRTDELAFNMMKGEVELHKGNHAAALEYLETASTLDKSPYTKESLGYYYMKVGDWENAIKIYEEIINEGKDMGWEGQECWVRAHIDVSKVYEEKGDREKAIESYERLIEFWKDADQDLPDLIEAKERLQQLQSSPV
jgi:tetratricopeptide (TPR) repeat protein